MHNVHVGLQKKKNSPKPPPKVATLANGYMVKNLFCMGLGYVNKTIEKLF